MLFPLGFRAKVDLDLRENVSSQRLSLRNKAPYKRNVYLPG